MPSPRPFALTRRRAVALPCLVLLAAASVL
jgi:hypothetical protein